MSESIQPRLATPDEAAEAFLSAAEMHIKEVRQLADGTRRCKRSKMKYHAQRAKEHLEQCIRNLQ